MTTPALFRCEVCSCGFTDQRRVVDVDLRRVVQVRLRTDTVMDGGPPVSLVGDNGATVQVYGAYDAWVRRVMDAQKEMP